MQSSVKLNTFVTDSSGKVKQDSILLGDFNKYVSSIVKCSREYQNVLRSDEYTNTASDSCYDGIIVHKKMRSKQYSKHGVVSKIQTEDKIKESDVSDHRPVWVELKYKPKETEESDSENEGEETGSVDEGEETESE